MNRRLNSMDLMELLRRLRGGESERTISQVLGLSRNTVARYRAWAQTQGFLEGSLPDLAQLEQARPQPAEPPADKSVLAPWRAEIEALFGQGYRPRQIWTKLGQAHEDRFTLSERSVQRLVVKLRAQHARPAAVVRIETLPGEEAQVDFGYAGKLRDPRTGELRSAWLFVMVLSWSRYMYAELVFDQQLATWLSGHLHAFTWFGGVPERIVIDNLKTAIIHAYVRERDPEVQRAYRELAEHAGFLISPCLPRRPEHKGKVERGGVAYLESSFLPLLPEDCDLNEGNRRLRIWLREHAGRRVHGTTHQVPLERFEQVERAALLPLPTEPFDPATWKRCTLHRDGYVVFGGAYYSAPSRLVGQVLWVRAGLQTVRLFTQAHELVASHPRARAKGERHTHPDHLPSEKRTGALATRAVCLEMARSCGPATEQVIAELLAARPLDLLRTAVRVLRLAERYSPERLEAACTRGLAFGDASLSTLKGILAEGLDQLAWPIPLPLPPSEPLQFARSPQELEAGVLGGGARWN